MSARNTLNSTRRRKIRIRLFEKSQGVCALCGNPMTFEELTIDHIIPVVKGGSSHFNNLQGAHGECNNRRGDKDYVRLVPGMTIELSSSIVVFMQKDN